MPQFRAKARAIELLGKGQIADLPTAITELWKNGYDAYAKTLDCKLFLDSYKDNRSPLFVLSDDGFGMTQNDILEKWLVLGTDSKSRGERIVSHFGLPPRPPMGEKGIGRLSVAYLGNTLLMITKKIHEPVQALFIDWRVLENYNFFLDDLELPLFTFASIDQFNTEIFKAVNQFKLNFPNDRWEEQPDLRQNVFSSLDKIVIPEFVEREVIQPFLAGDHHGTSFLVFNPHDQLLELSDKDNINLREDITVKHIRTALSGLHNDLNGSTKDFETHFYLYDNNGRYDLIDDFFTIQEMKEADHWLKGKFDEHGFFEGEIRIFNQIFRHSFRPIRPSGLTAYGPFEMEWGAYEGTNKNSLLDEDQFRNIKNKLDQFGGLYLYRDNFRILPYGKPDADFLEFETRRSERAGEYFFSHRRFIGYIDISRKDNYNLRDKAGREGFIQNKAYRDFRDDLIAFFIDVAMRYLKTSSNEADNTSSRAVQIKEIQAKFERQKEAEKKKNNKTKKAFLDNLENNQKQIVGLKDDIISIQVALKEEADKIQINYNNYNRLLTLFEEKRSQYRSLKLTAPRGTKFTKKQESAFKEFQGVYIDTDQDIAACLLIVEENRKKVNTQNLKLEYRELFNKHIKRLDQVFASYGNQIKDSVEQLREDLKTEKEKYLSDFISKTNAFTIDEDDNNEDLRLKIRLLDNLAEEQNKSIQDIIGGFINNVKNLNIEVDDDYLRGWYKEQSEKLEERLEDYEELAQLGISIEIIDHQFNVMYSQMKDAVEDIESHSTNYPQLKPSLIQLKGAFQHLEGNYKLLTPLYRTSRRTRSLIKGEEIEDYIKQFFRNEFATNDISFEVNQEFRDYEFFTYDSIIKPVFLNIINNANYWLIPSKDRRIKIECKGDEIAIMNSGERIDDNFLDDIFTLFFTRKKDGRGIGLYLAKKNLSAIGYEIYATNDKAYNKLSGACFIIRKNKIDTEDQLT
ncbi:MAG: ATP-binding protein [Bacteroidota bacterium]